MAKKKPPKPKYKPKPMDEGLPGTDGKPPKVSKDNAEFWKEQQKKAEKDQ